MIAPVVDGGGSMDYQRVALLCERVGTLLPLPGAALELIRILDRGEDSIAALENVISRDLGLTTQVLRVASDCLPDDGEHLSLRNAIATLGLSCVRSVALSMAIHTTIAQHSEFRNLKQKGSTCGLFVGQASRFMFARMNPEERARTGLSVDEVYAMGILCNLSINLVAKLAPELLPQTIDYARTTGSTLHAAFLNLHGRRLEELGALAAYTWGLPEVFVSFQEYLAQPSSTCREASAWSCVLLARELAEFHGLGLCDWKILSGVSQEAADRACISLQEAEGMVEVLKERLESETQAKPTKHVLRKRPLEEKAPPIEEAAEGFDGTIEPASRVDRIPPRIRGGGYDGDDSAQVSLPSRAEGIERADDAPQMSRPSRLEEVPNANSAEQGVAPSRLESWKRAILSRRPRRARRSDQNGAQISASHTMPVRPTRLLLRDRERSIVTQPVNQSDTAEPMGIPTTHSGRAGAPPGKAPKPKPQRGRARRHSSGELIELIRQKCDPIGTDTCHYNGRAPSGRNFSASRGLLEDHGFLAWLKARLIRLLEW